MAQDPDEYVKVKLKTQWGRRKALRIQQRAIRKRNIQIEDQQVEIQRLRSLLTDEQLEAFDERYADEDRTGKRNADKNLPRKFEDELTPQEYEAVQQLIQDLRARGVRASSLQEEVNDNGNGRVVQEDEKVFARSKGSQT